MEVTNNIKPHFEIVLENESKYSFTEIRQAKKSKQLEEKAANELNITVEEYRIKNRLGILQLNQRIKQHDEENEQLKQLTLKDFGIMVMKELNLSCAAKGGKFTFYGENKQEEAITFFKYKEVIRYMFGAPTESIDSSKFLYLFGRYGDGKSLLLKSCFKILKMIKGPDLDWSYFHIPTYMNQAVSQQSIKPFDVIFNCKNHMILDEFGDQVEKKKIYNDDKNPMRDLLLDKYDKWISNNGHGQKIAITSNLFPDASFFYHKNMQTETIHEFYDEKLHNKMKENYNLIRFPNVSFRDSNITTLL